MATERGHVRWLVAPLVAAALVAPLAGCGRNEAGNGPPAGTADLADQPVSLQQQFVRLVKKVSASVVQIRTPDALGSGVVFDNHGDVVTNAHVIGNAKHVVATLASGESHAATVVGRDVENDLALIRLIDGRPPAATFADSSQLEVGDIAVALGNPLGLRSSVTQGIVSAIGRRVAEENGVALSSVIQTSAEINPGNSGGALVDLTGRVIGIPTLAAIDPEMGSQAPGIGFAIDSNTVRRVAAALAGPR